MTKPSTKIVCALLSVATSTGIIAFADPNSAISRISITSHPAVVAIVLPAGTDHRG